VINNIRCRKLGELKNNEEKTFEIDENQAKVFVIADKLVTFFKISFSFFHSYCIKEFFI
jgi:hypothetical protein